MKTVMDDAIDASHSAAEDQRTDTSRDAEERISAMTWTSRSASSVARVHTMGRAGAIVKQLVLGLAVLSVAMAGTVTGGSRALAWGGQVFTTTWESGGSGYDPNYVKLAVTGGGIASGHGSIQVDDLTTGQRDIAGVYFTADGQGNFATSLYVRDCQDTLQIWLFDGQLGYSYPLASCAPADAVIVKWIDMGATGSFLGYPTINENMAPDGIGRYDHFQGGSIYWSPSTGAHEVHGYIRGEWASLGWERSVLGYPVTDETVTPDGVGRYNHFQDGSIYWTPSTDAHEVHGAIRDKWAGLGWERSVLGYPVTDETVTPDGVGRYNHFQGGSIYWTPSTDAHEVHGAIRDKWASLGWEQSRLGYPVSDELVESTGRYSLFQHGTIHWNSYTNAVTVIYSYNW